LSSSSSHTIPFDQSDPPNSREKNVVFACDRYIDAEKWVNAILMQIHNAQPNNSTTGQSFSKPVYAPPPDVRLTDVEEWVKSAKWKVCSVENGVRIFEIAPVGAPKNELFSLLPAKRAPPCLRISVPLGRSASDVFSTVMSYPPSCLTGVLKGVTVVESIDNATDIIHITLDPIFIAPTWTGKFLF